jgi:hypothetical protein
MIFITTYRVKPFMSKDEVREVMSVFQARGGGTGVVAHYFAADGSQGVVISEQDDAAALYENIVDYIPWIEYETKPFLTIEQAAPLIAAWLG